MTKNPGRKIGILAGQNILPSHPGCCGFKAADPGEK
jgi:hypothetical protein